MLYLTASGISLIFCILEWTYKSIKTRICLSGLIIFWSVNAIAAGGISAHYLQIHLPGQNRILSLAEVEVYSNGENIASGAVANQSSTKGKAEAFYAIDGITNGHFFKKSVTHTEAENNPWWELDLTRMHNIQKLVIFNRSDCCRERLSPARILLLDSRKNIVWQEHINQVESSYVFNLESSDKNTRPLGNNLLRNANFMLRTNPGLPDYWGIHDAVGRSVRDDFSFYGVTDEELSPVANAAVLKLENNHKNFRHLNIMPFRLHRKLMGGSYVYSVYIKSAVPGRVLKIYRSWANDESFEIKLSSEWKRYSVLFHYDISRSEEIQPVMLFPQAGTYYVSAPQLEQGTQASNFNGEFAGDNVGRTLLKLKNNMHHAKQSIQNALYRQNMINDQFFTEYDYYTDEAFARLILQSTHINNADVDISCVLQSTDHQSIRHLYKGKLIDQVIRLPIAEFDNGHYTCDVTLLNSNDQSDRFSDQTQLVKLEKSNIQVKQNRLNRQLYINNTPFYLIGIAPGGTLTLPDWYLEGIRLQGINTLFLKVHEDSNGNYDIGKLRSFLEKVSRYDLKVILGTPLSGVKKGGWEKNLLRFENLMQQFVTHTSIIGWYPLDEPAAHSWTDNDILSIYSRIKQIDPYRPILVNWAYDGIPPVIGHEPRGTLSSTDIYSMDYYPFQGLLHDMDGFTETSIRMFETALLRNKMSHSWLQLYGFSDVWREPLPNEMTYMAYLNFIFGSSYSYWGAKPENIQTWKRVKSLNRELKELADLLIFNNKAKQIIRPKLEDGFIYALWCVQDQFYFIMLNTHDSENTLQFDYSRYLKNKIFSEIDVMHELADFSANGNVHEYTLGAYTAGVIRLK